MENERINNLLDELVILARKAENMEESKERNKVCDDMDDIVAKILNKENVCALCEQPNTHFRGAKFGGKHKSLCSKCLAQFQIYTKEQYVVLEDRYE